MQDSPISQTAYKLRLRSEPIENGLLNWSPLKQLNSWSNTSETFTVRALIMAFGWRPFVFSGNRAHFFHTLADAQSALTQMVSEASLLRRYSVSPHLTLADVYMELARADYALDFDVEAEIYREVEIAEVMVSQHDLLLASAQDAKTDQRWYVVHSSETDGHLYLTAQGGRISWVSEVERGDAWSSADEAEALAMAKRVTRSESYYVYPLQLPSPAST